MVVQKAINNLKEGPKEDKVAVASGIAISIVVILLVAWAIFFFRSIAKGSQQINLGGAEDAFNFSGVKEAQDQLKQQYSNQTEDYMQLRNDAAAQQLQMQQQVQMQETQGNGTNQFGSPSSNY